MLKGPGKADIKVVALSGSPLLYGAADLVVATFKTQGGR